MKTKKVKVLIQRADRLGDMIFTLPVIEQLKQQYPNISIHVLTSKINIDLLDNHPLVDKLIIIDWKSKRWLTHYRSLIKQIKTESYTVYISLWNNAWMACVGKLARIPIRIGDSSQFVLKYFFNKKVFQNWNDLTRHQIQFNMDLLAPLFIKSNDSIRRVYIDEEASKKANLKIKKYLDPKRKHVLIMVSTGGSNFPLAEDTVLSFIERLLETGKFNIILAGQVSKKSQLHDFKRDGVLNEISKTSLKELIGLIDASDYYIGGDTGPTHIASYLNKPLVFYSPRKGQSPTSWGPMSTYFKIIRKDYLNADDVPETTGQNLYDVFCQLVHDISLNLSLSNQSRTDYLMSHSIRVLYCYSSQEDYVNALHKIRKLRSQGIMIVTFPLARNFFLSLTSIIKIVRKHNINVIQSKYISTFFMLILRFVMGTFYQYRMPVSVEQGIHSYIDKDDCFKLYHRAYKG